MIIQDISVAGVPHWGNIIFHLVWSSYFSEDNHSTWFLNPTAKYNSNLKWKNAYNCGAVVFSFCMRFHFDQSSKRQEKRQWSQNYLVFWQSIHPLKCIWWTGGGLLYFTRKVRPHEVIQSIKKKLIADGLICLSGGPSQSWMSSYITPSLSWTCQALVMIACFTWHIITMEIFVYFVCVPWNRDAMCLPKLSHLLLLVH